MGFIITTPLNAVLFVVSSTSFFDDLLKFIFFIVFSFNSRCGISDLSISSRDAAFQNSHMEGRVDPIHQWW